ncbi:hypothetical protein CR513_24251, partial [Mucuna pruriens]
MEGPITRARTKRVKEVIQCIVKNIQAKEGKSDPEAYLELEMHVDQIFSCQSYSEELHNKFQCLYQGSKSVDDYHKDIKMTIIRANILEDQEATMTRFLNWLNCDMADVVEMHQYVELQEMVHQAIKVEQQLNRRNSLKKNSDSSYFQWKNNSKKEVVGSHSKVVDSKKNQIEANPSKNQDINFDDLV